MTIITHLLAAMGGGLLATIVMAICNAAGKADEEAERLYYEKTHSGLLEED